MTGASLPLREEAGLSGEMADPRAVWGIFKITGLWGELIVPESQKVPKSHTHVHTHRYKGP